MSTVVDAGAGRIELALAMPGAGIGFLLALLLLWLGTEIEARLRLRHSSRDLAPPAAGALLIACGLWWPSCWVAVSDGRPPDLLPLLLALAAAATFVTGCTLVRRRQSRRTRRKSIGIALRGFGVPAVALAATVAAGMPAGVAAAAWSHAMLATMLAGVALVLLRVPGRTMPGIGPEAAARPSAQAIDPLTQLPTRGHFERRLASAMSRSGDGRRRLALLFLDLDGFKPVNDTYGHSIGDKVLEQVGERLRAVSRGHDVVARVGGDEFLMLLAQVDSDDTVAGIARRIVATLSQPFVVEQREVSISCSIGVAFHDAECTLHKLIARADAAMYAAKRSGGGTHQFYTPEMEVDAADSMALVGDLRRAITAREFELVYQPKIDARSGKVTAAEALLRWRHPTRGEIGPGVFIPIAERSGLIGAIGDWVIEDACRQVRAWRDQGLRMRVAINLSPQQMRRDDIVVQIAGALERHRIQPSLLTCEITETLAMEDTRATQETFRRLGALGTHLSIDDFGTGYSSLNYLRTLPAEELKIDRSFVTDLEHSAGARAIVDAIVKMAHALGLKVVAEGVETPRQQRILIELGCDELQGFLFAKPMSARALLHWAISSRDEQSTQFRESLFGETQQVGDGRATRAPRLHRHAAHRYGADTSEEHAP